MNPYYTETLIERGKRARIENKLWDVMKVGDRLAHELMFKEHPELLTAWWTIRGGHDACTVCTPECPVPRATPAVTGGRRE